MSGEAGAERMLRSEVAFRGRLITLRLDELRTARGATVRREVVVHPGAVAVVALDADDHVWLVRQYRHPIGRTMLEIPAGTLGPGEAPAECARRELREEIGLDPRELRSLTRVTPAPGYCTEWVEIFLARDLMPGSGRQDDDEEIEVERLPLAEAVRRAVSGEIDDAKTVIGLLLAAREQGHG